MKATMGKKDISRRKKEEVKKAKERSELTINNLLKNTEEIMLQYEKTSKEGLKATREAEGFREAAEGAKGEVLQLKTRA